MSTTSPTWRSLHPLHLWFLEYLVILYAIALVVTPLARHLPLDRLDHLFRSLVRSPLGCLAFAAVTFPTLCLMKVGFLDDPVGFVPQLKIVLAYAVFFAFGWLLRRHEDLLPTFRTLRRVCVSLALGLAAAGVGLSAAVHRIQTPGSDGMPWLLASAGSLSVATWLFVFGFTGLALRFLERPVPAIRYLSDSSYWLYIVHMPVLMAFQVAVVRTGWAAGAKMSVVLLASLLALLASYHLLVRATWIGAILNGRRHASRRDRPFHAASPSVS